MIQAVRPEYHKLPFTLTLPEIEDAVGTIQGILDMYDLPRFRETIKAMRDQALQADEQYHQANGWDVVYVTDQLIKLVECLCVLYKKPDEMDYWDSLEKFKPKKEEEPPAS